MTTIEIDPHLMHLLQDVAKRENRDLDEVIQTTLHHFAMARAYQGVSAVEPEPETKIKDVFRLVAEAADKLGETSDHINFSERSRDLLNTDYPEYLMRRLREQDIDE